MTKKITKILFLGIILLNFGFALYAAENDADPVLAVNGVEITVFDVNREVNMMYQQAVMQGVYPDKSEIPAYQQSALNTLVGRELLVQDAEKKDYSADPAEVDEYIDALVANYGSRENLEQALAEQGMSFDKLRKDAERYQVINAYVDNEIRNDISIDEAAAQDYYSENQEYFKSEETVKASHILIKTSEDADQQELDDALSRIKEIREKIVNGGDFAELAKEYSEGPSGENGGALGEFGHGQMVPPFDRAVFALEPGELSQPVQTQYGFHLIKLTEKNESRMIAFNDVKSQIIDYLTDVEVQSRVNSVITELRDEADIKVF